MIKLYNSLSQTKEEFTPLQIDEVKMYVCGITPYDTTHLGHAFLYTFFDSLIRYFKYKKYTVTYVQNITDIDDDILKRAARDGRDWRELGQFWTDKFVTDLKALNILMPDHYVKATDSIAMILEMVEELVNENYAYSAGGNVYFRTQLFKDYGKLSKFTETQMTTLLKERGGNPDDVNKEHPLDFILWQASGDGEPFWESEWGRGRPGWHIECSAMVSQYLGDQIDIHGGGRDLIYPHHESEIAQSESFTHKQPYVKYWMHASMLQYEGEKMSKSLGNLVMVSDLLKTYSANAVRWVLLSHHYRLPWEFFNSEIEEAEQIVGRITGLMKDAADEPDSILLQKFEAAMENDVSTDVVIDILKSRVATESKAEKAAIKKIFEVLGFVIPSS